MKKHVQILFIKEVCANRVSMVPYSITITVYNECTCSTGPSPQVWFGKLIIKKITADNNNYYNYYTEIILYMCVCVCFYLHSKSYQEYII